MYKKRYHITAHMIRVSTFSMLFVTKPLSRVNLAARWFVKAIAMAQAIGELTCWQMPRHMFAIKLTDNLSSLPLYKLSRCDPIFRIPKPCGLLPTSSPSYIPAHWSLSTNMLVRGLVVEEWEDPAALLCIPLSSSIGSDDASIRGRSLRAIDKIPQVWELAATSN